MGRCRRSWRCRWRAPDPVLGWDVARRDFPRPLFASCRRRTRRPRRCIETGQGVMADTAETRATVAEAADRPRRAVPRWVITVASLVLLLLAWEFFGRDVNPVFGSYPSAILEAGIALAKS